MIREIVIYGDPVLRKKGKQIDEITEEIRTLAQDMIETMHDAHGVGLAAQQVGESIQLTVENTRLSSSGRLTGGQTSGPTAAGVRSIAVMPACS